jgi:hypothetical protein
MGDTENGDMTPADEFAAYDDNGAVCRMSSVRKEVTLDSISVAEHLKERRRKPYN